MKTFVSLKAYSDYSVSARSCVNVTVTCVLCVPCVFRHPRSLFTGPGSKTPGVTVSFLLLFWVHLYISYQIRIKIRIVLYLNVS